MVNSRDLNDLRPDVRVNVKKLLELCSAQGLKVLITQTVRDDEYQAYLYAQGRTRPGAIVTNSRTTTFHGRGLAVDFCQNIKGHEYDDVGFFANVATIAKGLGFSWGGDWKTFVDYPHLQWDNHGNYTTAMLRAAKTCPAMPEYKAKEEANMEEKRYNTLKAIEAAHPWAVEAVGKLVASGAYTDGKLDMSYDMLRIIVGMLRFGRYVR